MQRESGDRKRECTITDGSAYTIYSGEELIGPHALTVASVIEAYGRASRSISQHRPKHVARLALTIRVRGETRSAATTPQPPSD